MHVYLLTHPATHIIPTHPHNIPTYIPTVPRGIPKWSAPMVDPKDDRETRPSSEGITDEEMDEVRGR